MPLRATLVFLSAALWVTSLLHAQAPETITGHQALPRKKGVEEKQMFDGIGFLRAVAPGF